MKALILAALLLTGCASPAPLFSERQLELIKEIAEHEIRKDHFDRRMKEMEAEAKEADLKANCENRALGKELEDFENKVRAAAKKNRKQFERRSR